jgi:hypothetical protein
MTRRLFSYATSLIVFAAGGALYAQTAPPSQTPPASTQAAPQRDEAKTVTANGCLKQEKDVPALSSSRAEKAGFAEDYVLTNAKLTGAGAPSGAGMPSGKQMAMYRITGLDTDKQLKPLLNQQVEVTGRLEPAPRRDAAPPSAAPDRPSAGQTGTQASRPEDLQEIRATSIKSIASTCTGGTS